MGGGVPSVQPIKNGVVLPENRGRQKSGSRATPHQDLDLCSYICSGGFQAPRHFPALSEHLCVPGSVLGTGHWEMKRMCVPAPKKLTV